MFDSFESAGHAPFGEMARKQSANKKQSSTAFDNDQAERLKRLREAMGYPTANAFAAFLRVSPQRWNNFERGYPLSREIIFRLVQSIPGLTSDWLYFAKPDGLSLDLARRLGELGPRPGK